MTGARTRRLGWAVVRIEDGSKRHQCAHDGVVGWLWWESVFPAWMVRFEVDGIPIATKLKPSSMTDLREDDEAEARARVVSEIRRIHRQRVVDLPPVVRQEAKRQHRAGRPCGAPNIVHGLAGLIEVHGKGSRAATKCGIIVLVSGASDDPARVVCKSCIRLAAGGGKIARLDAAFPLR